jgi:hypothetical protein
MQFSCHRTFQDKVKHILLASSPATHCVHLAHDTLGSVCRSPGCPGDTGWFADDKRRWEPPMAFNESLAARIRKHLARRKSVEEKKILGGVGFLLHGNMLVGVWKYSLIARLGPDEGDLALLEPHVLGFPLPFGKMSSAFDIIPRGGGL